MFHIKFLREKIHNCYDDNVDKELGIINYQNISMSETHVSNIDLPQT